MKKLASRHLWLFARIELGLSRVEFMSLTFGDWNVACRIWAEKMTREVKRQDQLVARLAFFNNLAVVPRNKGDKLPRLDDYLPTYGKKKAKSSSARVSAKEVFDRAQALL